MAKSYIPRRDLPKPNLKIDFVAAVVFIMFGIFIALHVVAGNMIVPNIVDVQRTLKNSHAQGPMCVPDPSVQFATSNTDSD